MCIRDRYDYKAFALPEPNPAVQPLIEAKVIEQPEPFNYFSKPQQVNPENWDQEILDLEAFFQTVPQVIAPLKIQPYKTPLTDIGQFVSSHLEYVKANNGNRWFRPYLDRLHELKHRLISAGPRTPPMGFSLPAPTFCLSGVEAQTNVSNQNQNR